MRGDQLANQLEGIVHEETQQHATGFDLTVAQIHAPTSRGRLDFGGSEFEPAQTTPIETSKRAAEDTYGWWSLEEGTYLLAYNESLPLADDAPVLLSPRPALLEQGITHPTLPVTKLPRVPIHVPDCGARIKENARVSTLTPL